MSAAPTARPFPVSDPRPPALMGMGGPLLALLGAVTVACGDGGTAPAAAVRAAPAALVVVSGDSQVGKANEALERAFVVQVTDAAGAPLQGERVRWSIASGAGEFPGARGPGDSLTSITTISALLGTSVDFMPTVAGTSIVEAAVVGHAVPPARFTVHAPVLVIRFYDDVWMGGFYRAHVQVPVGTTIEWVGLSGREWTVTAVTAPTGGELFASGTLAPDARFQFVPRVPGTWEYGGAPIMAWDGWPSAGTIVAY